jgi:hypothetical protein
MALAICVQHKLEAEEKAEKVFGQPRAQFSANTDFAFSLEQLRGHLDAIAEVTYSDELDNKAYCWFRKSPDSLLEGTWICGFEMLPPSQLLICIVCADSVSRYNNEDALTVVHRGSSQYHSMRKASVEDELWGKAYPEIIFLESWIPSGFLNKGSTSSVFFKQAQSAFIALTTYTFSPKDKDLLYLQLSDVAGLLQREKDVACYLPLVRKYGQGSSVIVFEQYQSKEVYDSVVNKHDPLK